MEEKNYPIHIDIDLSNKCNLRCSFCHLSYFTPKERSSQISLEVFDQYITPIIRNLKSLTLFSKYEVLTCRDFTKIYKRIREYEIDVYFSSNGLLINEDIIEAIVGHLKYLTISITGFSKERYNYYMRSDGFDTLQKNLEALNKRKEIAKTVYPILRISTVGMQSTLDDLPLAIDFAKKFNAQEGVQLTSMYVFDSSQRSELPSADITRYNLLTNKAMKYAEDKNVKLVLQSNSMDENKRLTSDIGHKFCSLPWERISVQPNGDVYPCPVAYKAIGNIYEESIDEIWKGKKMLLFREGVNNLDSMNVDCQKCIHCRHHSISDISANDFSDNEEFIGGMTRKKSNKKFSY